MKQKLIIENFGSIKKVELEIDKYLLLIGEQATGKSTIAKLIFFFKSLRQDLISYLYNDNEIDNSIEQDFIFAIRRKFTPNFFGTTKHMNPFHIVYIYQDRFSIELTLNEFSMLNVLFTENELVNVNTTEKPPFKMINIFINIEQFRKKYIGNNTLFDKRFSKIELEKQHQRHLIEQDINRLYSDNSETYFIPAGRSILATLSEQLQTIDTQNLDYLMKVFLQRIQRLKRGFNQSFEGIILDAEISGIKIPSQIHLSIAIQIVNRILKGTYFVDKFGEKIFYDDENFVKLNFASSGQQEVVWILQQIFVLLLNQEKTFLVIEEPEAHLYPVAQKSIIELISLYSKITDSQIIITTHSPYILSSFNNLLFANNVGKRKPDEVKEIINSEIWINSELVGAKSVKDGKIEDIMDNDLQLIRVEEIDKASALINKEFDMIFNIEE